jgi:hypothetical protein
VTALPELWRQEAAVLRRRGAEGQAATLESCAAELEAWEAEPGAPARAPAATSANGADTPDEQLLTVQEVATRFGLTPDWLYRHWKVVGGVKLGRKVLRFPASALTRYLAAQRKSP